MAMATGKENATTPTSGKENKKLKSAEKKAEAAEEKIASLRDRLAATAGECERLRREAGKRARALDRETNARQEAEGKAARLENLCRELQLRVKRAELVSAEERVAGAKRAETFDSKLKEYKESFEGVITEHQERTKAVFAAVDEKEAENKRLKDLSGDVLKKLEEDAQRTQKEREKHAKDVGQALKLVEQFQARAEAAEAVSEKLREEIATRDSSEASVKATIEKVHSSIAAVTKKNTEKDDTIRQLLKSQESYSKQIKDATTALQETSNRHKKLIARAEKAERRAEAMERLCRTLREQEKEQVVVFDKVEKVDVGALRAEKPAATAESVGARVEAHAGSDGPAAEGIAEGDRDSSAGQ